MECTENQVFVSKQLTWWFIWGFVNIMVWYIVAIVHDFFNPQDESQDKKVWLAYNICYLFIALWYVMGLFWRFKTSSRVVCGDVHPSHFVGEKNLWILSEH